MPVGEGVRAALSRGSTRLVQQRIFFRVFAHPFAPACLTPSRHHQAALAVVAVAGPPALAAPGDPFDVQQAQIFIAQGGPTALSTATTDGSGTVTFTPEGSDAGLTYNAIGFDEGSGYVFAIANSARAADSEVTAVEEGALIRVGQDGEVTQVGT